MIVFSLRELKRAWRESSSVFKECEQKTNAHRLILFYAVETGLKAVMLKREGKQDSENMFFDIKHDLNKLLSELKVARELHLPKDIHLDDLTLSKPHKQRNTGTCDLNQVWRYGAQAKTPTDAELEEKLCAIDDWINGELK
ncbi:hypothetical protein [Methylomonas rivi]|uniref:HEPN domain-containing protein n=1 Tax=Methylomonas rivi TaxID=2952226 RepID=A0ABT1U1R1_9GAMM|nr:hypothetical protein [Methylomonas sp. WSC-6]MCQ8127503.1 hypothetical protein [Methylomonas sp. WSC-6]